MKISDQIAMSKTPSKRALSEISARVSTLSEYSCHKSTAGGSANFGLGSLSVINFPG